MMNQEHEWITLYEKLLEQQNELVDENNVLRDKYMEVSESLIEKQEDQIELYKTMLRANEDLTYALAELTSVFLNDPDVISDELVEWFDTWLENGLGDLEDDEWPV